MDTPLPHEVLLFLIGAGRHWIPILCEFKLPILSDEQKEHLDGFYKFIISNVLISANVMAEAIIWRDLVLDKDRLFCLIPVYEPPPTRREFLLTLGRILHQKRSDIRRRQSNEETRMKVEASFKKFQLRPYKPPAATAAAVVVPSKGYFNRACQTKSE